MLVRRSLAAPEETSWLRTSEIPAVKVAVTLLVLAIAAPVVASGVVVIVAVEAEPITTLVAAVTKAAVT